MRSPILTWMGKKAVVWIPPRGGIQLCPPPQLYSNFSEGGFRILQEMQDTGRASNKYVGIQGHKLTPSRMTFQVT